MRAGPLCVLTWTLACTAVPALAQDLPLPNGTTTITAPQLETRRRFDLPVAFPAVRAHYARQLRANPAWIMEATPALVRITTGEPASAWAVMEWRPHPTLAGHTVLRVTPRFHLETLAVAGEPPPYVAVVMPRSPHATAPTAQDHLERGRSVAAPCVGQCPPGSTR